MCPTMLYVLFPMRPSRVVGHFLVFLVTQLCDFERDMLKR